MTLPIWKQELARLKDLPKRIDPKGRVAKPKFKWTTENYEYIVGLRFPGVRFQEGHGYTKANERVHLVCPEHGNFTTLSSLMLSPTRAGACAECSERIRRASYRKTAKETNPAPIGKRMGMLTVVSELERVIRNGTTYRQIECKCDCGNTKAVSMQQATEGTAKSCGCIQKSWILKPGEQYNHLTVVEGPIRDRSTGDVQIRYKVRCVCGKEFIRLRQAIVERGAHCGCINVLPLPVGERHAMLTAIGEVRDHPKGKQQGARCDCGRITWVHNHLWGKKGIASCGCLTHHSRKDGGLSYRQSLVGQKFNGWTITGPGKSIDALECQCSCGAIRSVAHSTLKSGASKGCKSCADAGRDCLSAFLEDPIWAATPTKFYLARVNGSYLKPGIAKDPDVRADDFYKGFEFISPTLDRCEAYAIEQHILKSSLEAVDSNLPGIYRGWGGFTELRLRSVLPSSWYVSKFWELLEACHQYGWETLLDTSS